jgi:rubrerythrin
LEVYPLSALKEIVEWIGMELYCKDTYGRLASLTENPYATKVLLWLSEACGNHAENLKNILKLMGWEIPDKSFKPQNPLSGELRKFTCDVEEIYWTARSYLNVEKRMRNIYRKLSREVGHPEAKRILEKIVEEEENHYAELSQLVEVFEKIYSNLGEAEELTEA